MGTISGSGPLQVFRVRTQAAGKKSPNNIPDNPEHPPSLHPTASRASDLYTGSNRNPVVPPPSNSLNNLVKKLEFERNRDAFKTQLLILENNQLRLEFENALSDGNLDLVKEYIGKYPDLFSFSSIGINIHYLTKAISSQKKEMVELLLENMSPKPSLSDITNGKKTILTHIISVGEADLISLFQYTPTDLSRQDGNGDIAMTVAAKEGDQASVNNLLARYAAVGAEDSAGKSALFYALMRLDSGMTGILIKNGATIKQLSASAKTEIQKQDKSKRENIKQILESATPKQEFPS